MDLLSHKVSHLNAVNPEILVSQIRLQDVSTGIEVIELNTSDEFDHSTDETLDNRLNNAWSYTNNETLQQIEDNYKINKKAREKRRLDYENRFRSTKTATNKNNLFIHNNVYSDVVGNQYIEDSQIINQNRNCFTITSINKHFIHSDTSSDADIDIKTSDDLTMEPNNWEASNDPYDEIQTYEAELDKETRTIWIYSFKNKHLLAEDDDEFDESNTAAKEMSSCSISSSTLSSEEKTKDKGRNIRRLGSPIPPTYIPRLNLSLGPNLSTLTEVSEPNKQTSPNLSHKSPKTRFRNSWVMTETEELDTGRSSKLEKSTNIVSWMELSSREKIRRSKEQCDKWVGSLLKLETPPTEELLDNNQQQTQDSSRQENTFKLQVDVDVHVSVNEESPEREKSRSLGTPKSAEVNLQSKTGKISSRALLKCAPVDIIGDALDRGDQVKFEQSHQVLCFSGPSHIYETLQYSGQLNMHKVGQLIFVEERPITIDRAAWEREEKEETETASYDFLTEKLKCANKNADKAWLEENVPFLVPSQRGDHAETTETSLSIQMSISDVATNRESWFKRFLKCINCFK